MSRKRPLSGSRGQGDRIPPRFAREEPPEDPPADLWPRVLRTFGIPVIELIPNDIARARAAWWGCKDVPC